MKLKVNDQIELSLISLDDAKEIFETIDSQRDYLGEWLPFVPFIKTITDEENFIISFLKTYETLQEYTFCIRENENFAGLVSLIKTDKANNRTEIGYWLSEPFQGRGIMTMAVCTLCDFAFNGLHFNRIQIRCAKDNLNSNKIPIRLGFTFEGTERDGEQIRENLFNDLNVYSLLKREFNKLNKI